MSESGGIRINRYLSEAGVCSRREADRRVEAGDVTIDGRTAVLGDVVEPGMTVTFKGRPVKAAEKEILIAFNKPAGVVCTTSKRDPDNIIDYINYPTRIYPIGRLDKSSEGLILLTNKGDLVNPILRAGNHHEKEYQVTVNHDLTEDFLEKMRGGVYLEEQDVTTRRCQVKQTGKRNFTIILTQGYNRQIRRMCETLGYRVVRLIRVRVMNIRLGNLKPGTYRDVTAEELRELKRLTKDSYSAPKGK